MSIETLSKESLTRRVAYARLAVVAFKFVKGHVVEPIKLFYRHATFAESIPSKSYERDVKSHYRDELDACLLYLRDFVEAIEQAGVRSRYPPQ